MLIISVLYEINWFAFEAQNFKWNAYVWKKGKIFIAVFPQCKVCCRLSICIYLHSSHIMTIVVCLILDSGWGHKEVSWIWLDSPNAFSSISHLSVRFIQREKMQVCSFSRSRFFVVMFLCRNSLRTDASAVENAPARLRFWTLNVKIQSAQYRCFTWFIMHTLYKKHTFLYVCVSKNMLLHWIIMLSWKCFLNFIKWSLAEIQAVNLVFSFSIVWFLCHIDIEPFVCLMCWMLINFKCM